MPHRIILTVTNDLTYDQRMHRICNSLVQAGYEVTLVGRKLPSSKPLTEKPFRQLRLQCFFNRGFAFYAEYNLRLLILLSRSNCDAICSIDLDTILAGLFASRLRGAIRVYDAHEYFTEMKEIRSRPTVLRIWKAVEKYSVPQYHFGYTVSQGLVDAFRKNYARSYHLIRNFPVLRPVPRQPAKEKFIVYQGAVNEARGFEYLIPAMQHIRYKLVVCGDGNFMDQLKLLIDQYGVSTKVELRGMMMPEELRMVASAATVGIGLAEKDGINQYHALPNKFLEYIHAALPQVAMDFPEYRHINRQFEVAVLLENLDPVYIAEQVNALMENDEKLARLSAQAAEARNVYCWQNEEQALLKYYNEIFS